MRKFEKVSYAPADTLLPRRSTELSAGYDFFSPCDIVIKPHGFSKLVMLNIKAYMPSNEFLGLCIRSSLATTKGKLMVSQGTAIIDADYVDNAKNEGNIAVMLENRSDKWHRLKKGDRICQGIFTRYGVTDDDQAKGVRKGGHGSTGR